MKRRVIVKGLRFRETAGLDGAIIRQFALGEIVEHADGTSVEADGYRWGRVYDADGVGGWTALKFTEIVEPDPGPDPEPEPEPEMIQRRVKVPALRLRTEPSLSADIVQILTAGQVIEVFPGSYVSADGFVWAEVQDLAGVGGWTAILYTDPVSDFRFKYWPTKYRTITQAYGANPEYYSRFGLPGHEGLDVRAPHDSAIYAVADGIVSMVYTNPLPRSKGGHNYGIHVRIKHLGGEYETIYAHLLTALVEPGQEILAGELIGRADNTGNSFGDHLHLTLKHYGKIIDPTPFSTNAEMVG